MALYARSTQPESPRIMLGPMLDERQQVRCEWVGVPAQSESVARLHGLEIAHNLYAGNVRAWERSALGTISNWHLASFGQQGPGVYYASYRVFNRDPVERSFRLSWWNGVAYQRGPIITAVPGQAIRVGVAVTISADDTLLEGRVHCVGSATGEIVTARVDQPHLAAGNQPAVFFDGDTTHLETMMRLYAAFVERERDL